MVRRLSVAVYAASAYVVFLVSLAWAVLFFVDGPVPTSVDSGMHTAWPAAIGMDAALLALFAVQHTVMARAGFKRWIARWIPREAERPTYVLAASAILLLTFWQWRPVGATLWRAGGPVAWGLVSLYGVGWLVVVASTFMVDHLDFFGLRRAFTRLLRRDYRQGTFQERWLYAWTRHPMMLGLLVAFWSTPRLTAGHLLFAVAASAYIAVGVTFEERDLRRELGDVYEEYARRVPAIVPRLTAARGRHPAEPSTQSAA